MDTQPLIFVVYDGIKNSVFESQVVEPLQNRLHANPNQPIIVVSFERSIPADTPSFLPESIQLICKRRLPFLGKLSLWHSVLQLKIILRHYKHYDIIARGPLAGWTSYKALNKKACQSSTVQARGILAEEYRYTHSVKNPFHKWRAHQLHKIEHDVYHKHTTKIKSYTIETVSSALTEYLIKTYNAPEQCIKVATDDIPEAIPVDDIIQWRYKIRKELDISDTATVYCYNGSVKPWQCFKETIDFFKKTHQKNGNSFLLILTQDDKACTNIIQTQLLDPTTYCILNIPHNYVSHYLSACDVGIIFRKKSPVNWVSRPTKAIEYRAAGLTIMHNNTVDWIIKNVSTTESSI